MTGEPELGPQEPAPPAAETTSRLDAVGAHQGSQGAPVGRSRISAARSPSRKRKSSSATRSTGRTREPPRRHHAARRPAHGVDGRVVSRPPRARRISVGELSILSVLLLVGALFLTVALRRNEAPEPSAARAPNAAPSFRRAARRRSGRSRRQRCSLPNKIAVLPCENQSPNPDDAYFASGLHQDIIWQLDKLRNLNTIPRVTVLRYAGTDTADRRRSQPSSEPAPCSPARSATPKTACASGRARRRHGPQTSGRPTTSRASPISRRVRRASRYRDEHRRACSVAFTPAEQRAARAAADRLDGGVRIVPQGATTSPTTTRRSSCSSKPSPPMRISQRLGRRWRSLWATELINTNYARGRCRRRARRAPS